MGVAATIVATLASGYLYGRSQQDAYNQQAAQAETNATIANKNADKVQANAELQAQNNAINEENKRRKLIGYQNQQLAKVGASGITLSGSALSALTDSKFNMDKDLAIGSYNDRQNVDNMFQKSTDYVNQRDIYKDNANAYRQAGKRAMMNSMLGSVFSLAGSLYSSKSAGAQKSSGVGNTSLSFGTPNYIYDAKSYSTNYTKINKNNITW